MRKSFQQILTEYGPVAVAVYFTIFGLTLAGFWVAVRTGWQPASAAGDMGSLAAAYIATKVTQPLRIGATLALTPFVAQGYGRLRGARPPRAPR